jgi:hypothetical protein
MKSARERARDAVAATSGPDWAKAVEVIERILAEHASDQRHLAAQNVHAALADLGHPAQTRASARSAALDAPASGEQR